MLPTSFTSRFSELVELKDQELVSEAQRRFSKRSAEYAAQGKNTPQATLSLHHEIAVWMTTARVESGVEALKRLLSSGHDLAYSDNLATELKQLIDSRTTETWCKQLVDRYGVFSTNERATYDNDLFRVRREVLKSANLDIDLIVDLLRSQIGKSQTQAKELEQKFGILLSPGQARIDFDVWSKELGPKGRSIAILFIDIDNFKRFNTKHTETVIDETLLPDTMRLINVLANHRGGAYRQGGEEFLVILPNYDQTEASTFAEKLRVAFESATFMVGSEGEHLTVSIGVALCPQHGQTYDETLKRANQAKADAKHTKNTCVVADS